MIYTKNNYLQYFDDKKFVAQNSELTLEEIEMLENSNKQRKVEQSTFNTFLKWMGY